MSYCSENRTRCDRTRFFTSMGALGASFLPTLVPIYNPGTLAVAALQIALNRIQPALPDGAYRLLNVDGEIGPLTTAALQIVTASGVDGTAEAIQAAADQKGLDPLMLMPVGPFAVGDKAAPPPPPAGTPGLPQPMIASSTMIVIAAVGVGVVLALMKKRKGRR